MTDEPKPQLVVPEKVQERPVDRVVPLESAEREADLCARMYRVRAAFLVHKGLAEKENPLELIAQRLDLVEAWWNELVGTVDDRRSKLADQIAVLVEEIEHDALEADAGVPMSSFRLSFDETKLSYESAFAYTQFLALHLGERRDRIEFMVTRMLSRPGAGGPVIVPPEEAKPLLEALTPRRATPDSRRTAIAFLHEAMGRLIRCSAIDEIFDSGLMIDLQGYKRTLGDDFLDPEILYALAALNVTLTERLQFLVAQEGLPPGELRVRFAKLDAKLRSIFKDTRIFDSPTSKRYGAMTGKLGATLPPQPSAARRSPSTAPTRYRAALRLIAAVIVIAGGVSAGREAWLRRDTMQPLRPSEAKAISTALVSADVSGGVLIGRVGPDWQLLSLDERRKAARELRDAIKARGLRAALVFDPIGTRQIIHVEGSSVVSVE